jgi:hypothetical protein
MPSTTTTTVTAARRRFAATAAATALALGPVLLTAATPAAATGDHGDRGGKASAVVLRTGLDVSLLNKTVNVPLRVSLNEVQAPASADKTALTVNLDGVDQGRPFHVLTADVAKARATVEGGTAEGSTRLAHAKVHVPGLPLLSLIEVGEVTSTARCEAGKAPVAESNLLGAVTVLGKKITLTTGGTTDVKVPGVGEVTLTLSERSTTSNTAAASALHLKVSVNPLKLNVAEVEGEVTLAGATCETPKSAETPQKQPSDAKPADPQPQGEKAAQPVSDKAAPVKGDLAETGGNSTTPYIAGGAIVLLAAGAGAVGMARRGRGRAGA